MLQAIQLPAADRAAVPHLDQYFGTWAMQEQQFQAHWQWASRLNLSVHLNSPQATTARMAASSGEEPTIRNGIAIVGLSGTLMKQQSSYSASSSTVLARRKIRAAASNPDVGGIMLVIESPGGTVAGTAELADDIAAAGKQKPVWAYAEDLCCSAAFWAGSQAQQFYANKMARVGSIGTFLVVHDYSEAAAKEGIKVHVVRAGAFKGAGVPGTQITDELLAELQSEINTLNEHFVAAVAAGRKMTSEQASKLADGRVYVGASAKKAGLIDGVQSFDQTFSQFVSHVTRRPRKMEASQTLEHNAAATVGDAALQTQPGNTATLVADAVPLKPAAASVAELQAACPGASSDFILAQLSGGATVASAQTAFIAEQNKQLAATNKQLADATAAAAAKPAEAHRGPGVRPLPPAQNLGGSAAEVDGDPVAAWEQAVSEEMTRSRCTKAQATQRVATREPKLRESYVAAFNARTPEQRRAS